MNRLYKVFNFLLNAFLMLTALVLIWIFGQVFLFTSFRIPTNSMEPELEAGDYVLVNKTLLGPRIFDISDAMQDKQVKIYRIPGLESIKRNDVLAFNFPHPNTWSKIEMHILKYYIKRCIGLPGDTLIIRNGFYSISGVCDKLGHMEGQALLSSLCTKDTEKKIFNCYPDSTIITWSIKNYGPFYIPKKGDKVKLTPGNYVLYHKLIHWEQGESYHEENTDIFLNNIRQTQYCFQHNYYFMAGDRVIDSQDSRYWGLLPEEFIVGKATMIWKSISPLNKSVRWDRFLKRIK